MMSETDYSPAQAVELAAANFTRIETFQANQENAFTQVEQEHALALGRHVLFAYRRFIGDTPSHPNVDRWNGYLQTVADATELGAEVARKASKQYLLENSPANYFAALSPITPESARSSQFFGWSVARDK